MGDRPIYRMRQSRSTISLLWYLLFLSMKYDLDLERLYKSLVKATITQRVMYGALAIECRAQACSKDSIVFFLTNESDGYVAQLHIPKRLLEGEALLKIMDLHGLPRNKILKGGKFSTYFLNKKHDMKIAS